MLRHPHEEVWTIVLAQQNAASPVGIEGLQPHPSYQRPGDCQQFILERVIFGEIPSVGWISMRSRHCPAFDLGHLALS